MAAAEGSVACLVAAEGLEKHAVGMHRDDRVEHQPHRAVVHVEVAVELCFCVTEGLRDRRLARA
jgi:hypothetical protein